jgi:hypothetical protein
MNLRSEMINPACDRRRAKPVIDIDDRHACRAAVEHAQQCREAAKTRSVPDAGGDGDYRNLHQSADNARQRSFHPSNDDDRSRRREPPLFAEQTVDAGDADIEQPIDGVAHYLCGHARLLGDRQVGGAGRGDKDGAAPRLYVTLTVRDSTRDWVKHCVGNVPLH